MTAEITVNTRGAQRLATLEAVRVELDRMLTPIEGGALDGIEVVSKGEIAQAILNVKAQTLPPIDTGTAEVRTPADVYVDAICPECDLPTRVLVQLSAVLETTREAGSTIKLKAKAKSRGHVHHQLALEEADPDQQDFGLEDIVRPEGQLSDDERDEPGDGDTAISTEPKVVRDLLLLVLSDATITGLSDRPRDDADFYEPLDRLVESWDAETRTAVVRWASAVHLVASDHDDVEIPPEPLVITEMTRPSEPDAADADAEAEAIHQLHVVPPPAAKGDEPDDLADLPF